MTMVQIRLVSAAILSVLAIVLILQNGGSVHTKFLFMTVTMPQSALLAITMLAGITTGILMAIGGARNWGRKGQ